VFGEIYVRNDPYANGWTEDKIEDLGGEVLPTWILEWFEFVNHSFLRKAARTRDLRGILAGTAKRILMSHVRRTMERPFAGLLEGRHHPSSAEVLAAARPYMKENIGGEAILCIGAPVALAARGAIDGAVNVLPFTCLPGTIVTAVSKRLRRDFPDLPWLNLSFDGQEDTDNDARLEAFMHQVRAAASSGEGRRQPAERSAQRAPLPDRAAARPEE
jgi:predicted nucleotide-binding protein (sugar kinase/HSP70/actin superfamily)